MVELLATEGKRETRRGEKRGVETRREEKKGGRLVPGGDRRRKMCEEEKEMCLEAEKRWVGCKRKKTVE